MFYYLSEYDGSKKVKLFFLVSVSLETLYNNLRKLTKHQSIPVIWLSVFEEAD
jgi:hypothetical protein